MGNDLISSLSFAASGMETQAMRLRHVSENIANADTPGYRRKVISFEQAMDTGLVAGVPAFHIEELELRDAADRLWWRLELHEPVAENPLLTFELDQRPPGQLWLQGRDNNGNLIRHEVQA